MKFKIDDWIVFEAKIIGQVENTREENGKNCILVDGTWYFDDLESISKWEPKEGDFCWFWNNQKDLTCAKFFKMDCKYYIVSYLEKERLQDHFYFLVTEKEFKHCEPFLNTLPTILFKNKV